LFAVDKGFLISSAGHKLLRLGTCLASSAGDRAVSTSIIRGIFQEAPWNPKLLPRLEKGMVLARENNQDGRWI
jgi:hypothetical protein